MGSLGPKRSRDKLQGEGINTVAITGWSGAIGKEVAEVGAAVGTGDFKAMHAKRKIVLDVNSSFVN